MLIGFRDMIGDMEVSHHLSDIEFKGFMKLYRDYTKENYSFLMNDRILQSNNRLRFMNFL